jgi:hypothetical protein
MKLIDVYASDLVDLNTYLGHHHGRHLRRVGFDWARLGAPDLRGKLLAMAVRHTGGLDVFMSICITSVYTR